MTLADHVRNSLDALHEWETATRPELANDDEVFADFVSNRELAEEALAAGDVDMADARVQASFVMADIIRKLIRDAKTKPDDESPVEPS